MDLQVLSLFRRNMKYLFLAILLSISACATFKEINKEQPELAKFESDGCSLFPDGTPITTDAWLECCEEHDFHYWIGGTKNDREFADRRLQQCVEKKGYQTTAELMYLGVRLGGSPEFSTKFRWGYGWNYKRRYQSLSESELEQAMDKINKKEYSKYKYILHRHNIIKNP